jgi:hypothetical protein
MGHRGVVSIIRAIPDAPHLTPRAGRPDVEAYVPLDHVPVDGEHTKSHRVPARRERAEADRETLRIILGDRGVL